MTDPDHGGDVPAQRRLTAAAAAFGLVALAGALTIGALVVIYLALLVRLFTAVAS